MIIFRFFSYASGCAAICLFLSSCQPDAPTAPVAFTFSCEELPSDDLSPRHAVYALIGDYKTKLTEVMQCDTIGVVDYATYQIPAEAEQAVGGWWAGFGEYLYMTRRPDSLLIYHGAIDEMTDTAVRWELLAVHAKGSLRLR